ncbi:hypothetical protein [Bacillus sp. Brlt_9]|uniref:hypothetical protein n=1 Tax=Bacillus sp. Brlt_9 TaxID=3110916 RepID=UPI003F7BB96D
METSNQLFLLVSSLIRKFKSSIGGTNEPELPLEKTTRSIVESMAEIEEDYDICTDCNSSIIPINDEHPEHGYTCKCGKIHWPEDN